jgi:hypothetical protein
MEESGRQDTEVAAPPMLVCARCGGGFSMWLWQPRLRCPHCRTLGYPDRAMHNLLPLGWDCPACGAENDVSTNFCVVCGTGLTSRCLRCERPVYTAICPHCGAHQAAMLQYQTAQERRVTWEPIVRARIQEQQSEEQAVLSAVHPSPTGTIAEETVHVKETTRHRPSSMRIAGGLILILTGAYLLIRSFPQIFQNITLPVWVSSTLSQLQMWWNTNAPLLQSLTPDDQRYLAIFTTVVIGLSSIPFWTYLIQRLARRLFP